MDITDASAECNAVLDGVSTAVIAERDFLESVLMGIVGQGHVLIEDVPGTGKTLTARSFAKALGLSFSRIQFTPDLLPSDVTGTHVFNEGDRTFEFTEGPIFANVVLADEINRAPPKTQAALLEAMEEKQVTVDGDTHQLPDPFFVMATQNPVEQEGTFALPEAQVDRFAVKTSIGYPDEDGEFELLKRRAARRVQSPSVERVLTTERVRDLQRAPENVHVDDDLLRYMVAISRETRADPRVRIGVSPRGTQRLFEAARARAVIVGREYVTPDDVKRIARPVLAHRVVLTPDAKISDITKAEIIEDVLESVAVPTID
ncbi:MULTISPECIES: MoxR family ATPase [unclassified Haladaptatus]|uniref:AAA family ATPase n=1 Tax=unclassified Haladaptatus TaxID=2622732 RepID=UPI0023E8B400|nr:MULTISPECIES: MoxR family ATPase [unclassified Haladaptatus]